MSWWVNALAVVLAFLAMEGVAWFVHKYIMHGALWFLHRDHHKRETSGFFERNDFFFLLFATPGITCLAFGLANGFSLAFWIGLGITVYGGTYFLVHDLFIHQRFKVFRIANAPYFKAIRRAHKVHHKHLDKEDGECFGMLWVPRKYYREAKKAAA